MTGSKLSFVVGRIEHLDAGDINLERVFGLDLEKADPLGGHGDFVFEPRPTRLAGIGPQGLGKLFNGSLGGEFPFFDTQQKVVALARGRVGWDLVDDEIFRHNPEVAIDGRNVVGEVGKRLHMSRAKRIEDTMRGLVQGGVDGAVFPGAVGAAAWRHGDRWQEVSVPAGRLGSGYGEVDVHTIYDLASLTKSAVAMSALRLIARGRMKLDDRVAGMTLESLLTHRSGLAAWVPFYETLPHASGSEKAKHWILTQAASHAQTHEAGQCVYSDLGYILTGQAIAEAAGTTLDRVVDQEIAAPLRLELFFGSERGGDWVQACAPTTIGGWRGRELKGEVNDDNCAALGGVSGHAGLFGTAIDVLHFGTQVVDALVGRNEHWDAVQLADALAPRAGGSYLLGWDGKSETSAAGKRMGERTFGHLGYTGTSLFCDPDAELVVVLLSNRVYPDDNNTSIREFRPRFHDAVFEAFDG